MLRKQEYIFVLVFSTGVIKLEVENSRQGFRKVEQDCYIGALQLLNWSHVATAVDHKMQMPASPFQFLCEPGHLLDVCEPSKGSGLTWSAVAG